MNGKNLETVSKIYEALNKKDLPFMLSAVDPQITVSQTDELPWGGNYQGVEGLKNFLAKLLQHTDSKVTVDEYFEAGNQVVAIGRSAGEVRGGQTKFDVRVVHIWTINEGKIIRFEPYIDTPAMLKVLNV
jgi:uncharacterized protein